MKGLGADAAIIRQCIRTFRALYLTGYARIDLRLAEDGRAYVLEANPRASRTVPLVSKVCNIPMARIAAQVMLGKKLSEMELGRKSPTP